MKTFATALLVTAAQAIAVESTGSHYSRYGYPSSYGGYSKKVTVPVTTYEKQIETVYDTVQKKVIDKVPRKVTKQVPRQVTKKVPR